MITDENKVEQFYNRNEKGIKKALSEKEINQVTDNNSLEINFDDIKVRNIGNKIKEGKIDELNNEDRIKIMVDEELKDDLSLEAIYREINKVNDEIANKYGIRANEIDFSNKCNIQVENENESFVTSDFSVTQEESTKQPVDLNAMSNLCEVLKNAQFNSVKLKGKIFELIHSEIYRIESEYQNKLACLKQEKVELENALNLKMKELAIQENAYLCEIDKIKSEKNIFIDKVVKNVHKHLEEWKFNAQSKINAFLNKK